MSERRCDGVLRRDFLRIGGLTAFGLGVADLAKAAGRTARRCVLIWLDGGPSHLETFDLKPDTPEEVRGPFKPISTSVSGVQICELMPQTAKRMQHVALIRCVRHLGVACLLRLRLSAAKPTCD